MKIGMEKGNMDGNRRSSEEVIEFLGTFFLTLAVIMVAVMLFLKITGCAVFTVDSGSMTPAYPENSLVVAKETDPIEIREGNVITYVLDENGTLVTHRVVRVEDPGQTFITKGDANSTEDPNPVSGENIVGRVIFKVPLIGEPARVLLAQENRTIVTMVILMLFTMGMIGEVSGRLKEEKPQKGNTNEAEKKTGN